MEEEVGFDFIVPSAINSFDKYEHRSDEDDGMAEVVFKNGDEKIRFHKIASDSNISGN